jgi:DNA repair protein RadC
VRASLSGNPARETEITIMTKLYTADCTVTGGFREAHFEELIAAARQALTHRVRKGTLLSSPRTARDYLTTRLGTRDHEVFTVLFLDNRHRLIDCQEMFRGTIDGASVHPREVVKEAIQRGAAAVILAHNHPSGVAEPSQADELITQRLRDALALVDIRVLDHLIVAGGDVVSLAERGVL